MNASDSNTQDVYKVNSLTLSTNSNAVDGHVRWDPCRSLWNGGMLLAALVLGPMTFTWGALAVFVVVLAIIMCAGHSVGFHRLLIHRTFECPTWLELTLVWIGVLFGMQGPYWMNRSTRRRESTRWRSSSATRAHSPRASAGRPISMASWSACRRHGTGSPAESPDRPDPSTARPGEHETCLTRGKTPSRFSHGRLSNDRIAPVRPCRPDQTNGVSPRPSLMDTSAPASISILTVASSPYAAAQ